MTGIQRRGSDTRHTALYDGSGTLELEYYFADSTRLGAQLMRYVFEPGTSEGLHLHDASDTSSCTPDASDEIYLVTAGELVMVVDGVRTVLGAGDAAYAPAGSLHGIVNESDQPAELVLLFGPPTASGLT